MDDNGPVGLYKILRESPFKDDLSKLEFLQECEICRYSLNNSEIYGYIKDIIKRGI